MTDRQAMPAMEPPGAEGARPGDRSRRPLHIAFVTIAGGGGETHVHELARGLVALGQRASVVYLHHSPPGGGATPRDVVRAMSFFAQRAEGEFDSAAPDQGFICVEYVAPSRAHYYYGRIGRLLPATLSKALPNPSTVKSAETAWALRRALQRIARASGGIDLIELPDHLHCPPAFLRGLAPYAVKLHSSDADWRYACKEPLGPREQAQIRVEAALLRHARLVYAPSAAIGEIAQHLYQFPRSNVAVLPYALDTDRFSPRQDDESSRGAAHGGSHGDNWPWAGQGRENRISILYVGRLDPYKGIATLALATESVLNFSTRTVMDIVGGDTVDGTGAALLARVPPTLHDRIVFHGRVAHADLPAYYRQAAVCVVPSRWDNSPNVVYEAMGCGTPVVASRVGGIPELVEEGTTGLLVPPDDPAVLAGAVTALLADPARREAMGRAARARAVERFDRAIIATQTLDLYRVALARTSAGRVRMAAI